MIDKTTANRIPDVVPFQEPVTFLDRTGGDNFTSYAVPRARRRKLDREDKSVPQEILVEAEAIWQIAAVYLPVVPLVRDKLVDGNGITWIVIHVEEAMNSTMWNLLCRRGVR